jgi:hypothetical protein
MLVYKKCDCFKKYVKYKVINIIKQIKVFCIWTFIQIVMNVIASPPQNMQRWAST